MHYKHTSKPMINITDQRIAALRQLMNEKGINATIIPQSDPHQSEYLADHWQARRWFSGFTGSAGTLVVTVDKAFLWVDSRYFLQAAEQVDGTEIKLMKIALPGTPTINEYLSSALKPGNIVGVDGLLYSVRDSEALKECMKEAGIKVDFSFDPVKDLWHDRPSLPDSHIIIYDTTYAGESADKKLDMIRETIKGHKTDAMLLSALDEIAWTLNIRSRDVQCNPVTTAYLLITLQGGYLFVNQDKVTPAVKEYLDSLGIKCLPYDSITDTLAKSTFPAVAVDPSTTSARIVEVLGNRAVKVPSSVPLAKAIKNPVEIAGTSNAMIKDGVALVKGFMEIERRVLSGENVTEMTVAEILTRHRSERDLYFDDSFDTIAGYGSHGAIVHYSATPDTDIAVGTDNLLLIDSGAQYLDGTTDITRTIIIGTPTPEQRADFTTVLCGNINLALAVFPAGTRGTQLDVLAHLPLWQRGLNYLHGTGHGIGHFLNVHEGPHSIRTNEIPVPLEPGMLVTDEPGVYIEGKYGIRCENVLLCTPHSVTPMGQFLQFEALTLFPFDNKLIDPSLMDDRQLSWLNNYHARVYDTLKPYLDDEERHWLADATTPLTRN